MGDLDRTLPRACEGGKDIPVLWARGGGTSKTGLDDVLAPATLSMLLEIRRGRAICSLGTIEAGLEPLDAFVTCMEQTLISRHLNEVGKATPTGTFLTSVRGSTGELLEAATFVVLLSSDIGLEKLIDIRSPLGFALI
jgi:hypothetical protein